MLLKGTAIVTAATGPCPKGSPTECFHCGSKMGEEHKEGCVFRRKAVIVEVKITLPIVVPSHWSGEDVDFHLNESSWCADNIVVDLQKYIDAKGDEAPCLCSSFFGHYRREATEEDLDGVNQEILVAGE